MKYQTRETKVQKPIVVVRRKLRPTASSFRPASAFNKPPKSAA